MLLILCSGRTLGFRPCSACAQIDPCRLATLNESRFWISKFDHYPYKRGERVEPEWGAILPSDIPCMHTLPAAGCSSSCRAPTALERLGSHQLACRTAAGQPTTQQTSRSSSRAERTAHVDRLVSPNVEVGLCAFVQAGGATRSSMMPSLSTPARVWTARWISCPRFTSRCSSSQPLLLVHLHQAHTPTCTEVLSAPTCVQHSPTSGVRLL